MNIYSPLPHLFVLSGLFALIIACGGSSSNIESAADVSTEVSPEPSTNQVFSKIVNSDNVNTFSDGIKLKTWVTEQGRDTFQSDEITTLKLEVTNFSGNAQTFRFNGNRYVNFEIYKEGVLVWDLRTFAVSAALFTHTVADQGSWVIDIDWDKETYNYENVDGGLFQLKSTFLGNKKTVQYNFRLE